VDDKEVRADIQPSAAKADIAPAPLPKPPVQYSPDGRWFWNGTKWILAEAVVAANPGTCMVCGAAPARLVTFRSVLAFVVFGITTTKRGVYCRNCGISEFRMQMNRTLLLGWWGIIHFFVNIFAIITNLDSRSLLMRLGPPTNAPSATPLALGRPVFLRPGFLLSVGLPALVVIILISLPPPKPFPAADQALIGTCAQKSGTQWSAVDCSANHNGKVVSLASDSSGCSSQETPAKLDDGNYTCIDTSQ